MRYTNRRRSYWGVMGVKVGLISALTLALLVVFLVPGHVSGEQPVNLVINGIPRSPDTPPVIVNGRVMVPIRFVSEALGCAVTWDNDTRTVFVSSSVTPGCSQPGDDGDDDELPDLHIANLDRKLECVTVEYTGRLRVDLTGWKLRSIDGGEEFTFPAGYSIGAGQTVRVWSGPVAMPPGPANLRWSTSEMWTDTGDRCQLIDPQGRVVHSFP